MFCHANLEVFLLMLALG